MFSRTPGKILKVLRNVSGIPASLSGFVVPGSRRRVHGVVPVRIPRPGPVMTGDGGGRGKAGAGAFGVVRPGRAGYPEGAWARNPGMRAS